VRHDVGLRINGIPPDSGAIVQGLIKVYTNQIYTNQINVLEGSTAVVEHKDKDQAAGLEIAESFNLCVVIRHTEHTYSCICLQ
jgi:hypothetical protein